MYRIGRLLSILTLSLLIVCTLATTPPAYASVGDLSVDDIQLVSSRRVGRTTYEFIYTATVTNAGAPLNNVVARVSTTTPATQIVEDTVVFGDIATGVTGSADTFTFRHNRRFRFSTSNLAWSFTADEAATNTPPVADSGTDQQVVVGSTVSLDGSGSTDADGDSLTYVWSLNTPTGSSATLSGQTSAIPSFTTDVLGDYVASLIVDDGTDSSAPDTVTISAVFSGANPPVISSIPGTTASLGSAYTYNVNATDPDIGDVLSYSLQLAPSGMSIDSATGLIRWTPGATGPADVDVRVTDSTGLSDRQIYLVTVNNGSGDQPPTLAPIADQSTIVGQTLMVTAMGSDPEGEAIRYSVNGSPGGLVINAATGELLWTPDSAQAGNFSATVTAMDPGGQTASQSFDISVLAETPNNPPVIDSVADQFINALSTLQLTLTASDADDNDILLFDLTGMPAGMQFDSINGVINWIPSSSDAGTVNLTAGVTDSAGARDTTSFALTVAEQPRPPVAVDDAYTVDRDAQLQIPAEGVLANDSDPNNDVLSAANTSVPTLGILDSFPGDGSFSYTPPANPNITIGLRKRCQSSVNATAASPLVGDWDHDGTTEIIGFHEEGFNSRIFVMDPTDCSMKKPDLILNFSNYGVFSASNAMAMANLDEDPDLELILIRDGPPQLGINRARLVAVNIDDGSLVWSLPDGASEAISLPAPNASVNYYRGIGPTLVDLDGDGSTEILMPLAYRPSGVFGVLGAIIAYNSDGTIRWEFSGAEQGGDDDEKPLVVADLDLDGTVEIIYHTNVVDHNGNLEFNLQTDPGANFFPQHLTVAIANFDNDPFPEILGRDSENIYLFEHTPGPATWTIPNVEFSGSTSEMTVGDFDGDGQPEFAFHGGTGTGPGRSYITAFDTDGTELWSHRNTGYVSTAGDLNIGFTTVAYDYDQDGKDEITSYLRTQDESQGIFIFRGDTGEEVARYTGDGGTHNVLGGRQIFPLIADLDDDGAAEIAYPISTGLGVGPLFVLEGLAGNPLPPARAIRNQLINQPTQVGLDGSIPAYPAPQWLIPGLNKHNGAAVVPFEDSGLTDAFNYLANDGTADSNEATVTIAVTNVNAPTIVSDPPLGGSPDFNYVYGALATDADFGEVLTWSLIDAPAGMSLSQFGVLQWLPQASDVGTHRVQIVVTDQQGNSDEQSFNINIVPPVVVPDLLGSDETSAGTALEAAGLAIGSITQGFSFTVPAGQVLSQSVSGGASSAAGAFINYVISLGPRPILVPVLTQLSESAALAQVNSTGLQLGSVTRANSETVPRGVVLDQSIAAFTEVAFQSTIDITVSSGPALSVRLDQAMIGSGASVAASVTVFDPNGVAFAIQPPVSVTVVADPGAVGTLPGADTTLVTTSADTRGSYRYEVDAGSFGFASLPFVVRTGLEPGDYYEPIAQFAETIDDAQSTYTQLVSALENNDLVAIQTLGQQLVAIRNSIDLESLDGKNAFAPESGFIPTSEQAAASGFNASFGELDQGSFMFASLGSAIEENISFLKNLNPASGRDDDVRARALNNALRSALEQFNANLGTYSVGAQVFYNADSYVLLSQQVPQLVRADLNATIGALMDNGLLALQQTDKHNTMIADTTPAEFYHDTRKAFFTLGGLMTGSAIRMSLIKNLYVPHITRLISAGLVLKAANALLSNQAVGSLTGIITGASLSFHKFNVGNSAIEAVGLSRDARSFTVKVIGPDKYQAWLDFATDFSIPTNAEEFEALITGAADAAAGSLNGTKTVVVHDRIRGCILDSSSACTELVVGFGFPVVHTSGQFPAPVLVIVTDKTQSKVYAGVYPFFPN